MSHSSKFSTFVSFHFITSKQRKESHHFLKCITCSSHSTHTYSRLCSFVQLWFWRRRFRLTANTRTHTHFHHRKNHHLGTFLAFYPIFRTFFCQFVIVAATRTQSTMLCARSRSQIIKLASFTLFYMKISPISHEQKKLN